MYRRRLWSSLFILVLMVIAGCLGSTNIGAQSQSPSPTETHNRTMSASERAFLEDVFPEFKRSRSGTTEILIVIHAKPGHRNDTVQLVKSFNGTIRSNLELREGKNDFLAWVPAYAIDEIRNDPSVKFIELPEIGGGGGGGG